MTTMNHDTSNSKQNKAIKHIVATLVAGFPFLLGIVLSLVNPTYLGILILPDSRYQPFGWLVSFIILVLAGLTYFGVITLFTVVARGQTHGSTMQMIILGFLAMGVLVSVTAMIYLILLGPAMLTFFQSDALKVITN